MNEWMSEQVHHVFLCRSVHLAHILHIPCLCILFWRPRWSSWITSTICHLWNWAQGEGCYLWLRDMVNGIVSHRNRTRHLGLLSTIPNQEAHHPINNPGERPVTVAMRCVYCKRSFGCRPEQCMSLYDHHSQQSNSLWEIVWSSMSSWCWFKLQESDPE